MDLFNPEQNENDPNEMNPLLDKDDNESEDEKQGPIFQNLYDLTEEEKDEIRNEQNERLKFSLQYMGPILSDAIVRYKKYRSIASPLKDDLGREITNRANIYVPYAHSIVESAMPRLSGRLPRVHAFPRKQAEGAKVDAIQDLILYALDRMGFLQLQQLWIRQFEIYGWSPLVFFWKNEERSVFERQFNMMTGSYEMKRVPKTIWDDFSGRVIDVFDSFLQPGVEIPEGGDWFMFREWMSKKDIAARVKAGVFYPEVLDYLANNPMSTGNLGRQNDVRNDRDGMFGLMKDFQRHSYGRYEVIYTLENNRIIVSIDGKILARVGDNPHPLQEKAMINLNLLPMINEPIGISTIEELGGLPDKLNVLTNARLDNISLQMNNVIVANKFSNTNWDTLVMEAGNVILTDDIEKSLKFLEIPDIGTSSEREILTTKEEMQFASAVSDYIVGVKSGARLADTATGVSSIIREANAKFALKLAAFEAYPLRKLVEAIHVYNMMYMPEEKRIHVLGPKGYSVKDIKLDEIMAECDFIIEPGSSSPLDQLSKREALLQLMPSVLQLQQVVDINKFMKEVFESMDIRNSEDMLLNIGKKLPQAEDVELAQAENVALAQHQEIDLMGNDQLHMEIHSSAMNEAHDPAIKQAIYAHLQQHTARFTAAQQALLAAGQNQMFGGQPNGNQPPNAAPGGGIPPVGGISPQAPGAQPAQAGASPAALITGH
jgi:hypothetical protein